jgi:hypothetical protein
MPAVAWHFNVNNRCALSAARGAQQDIPNGFLGEPGPLRLSETHEPYGLVGILVRTSELGKAMNLKNSPADDQETSYGACVLSVSG